MSEKRSLNFSTGETPEFLKKDHTRASEGGVQENREFICASDLFPDFKGEAKISRAFYERVLATLRKSKDPQSLGVINGVLLNAFLRNPDGVIKTTKDLHFQRYSDSDATSGEYKVMQGALSTDAEVLLRAGIDPNAPDLEPTRMLDSDVALAQKLARGHWAGIVDKSRKPRHPDLGRRKEAAAEAKGDDSISEVRRMKDAQKKSGERAAVRRDTSQDIGLFDREDPDLQRVLASVKKKGDGLSEISQS